MQSFHSGDAREFYEPIVAAAAIGQNKSRDKSQSVAEKKSKSKKIYKNNAKTVLNFSPYTLTL